MQRYFFDVVSHSHVQYDYRGREYGEAEQARQLAELIALDIECTDAGDLVGAEVQVRTVCGEQLYTVPIRELHLIAA